MRDSDARARIKKLGTMVHQVHLDGLNRLTCRLLVGAPTGRIGHLMVHQEHLKVHLRLLMVHLRLLRVRLGTADGLLVPMKSWFLDKFSRAMKRLGINFFQH